ncbi:GIY-YIG nuclease family protein [Saccharicrinis sp. FJH62]|uniref:GIY-YIG nuclease family protein n=1 Tax=Saccharicrinis sp. FJH62 TaxID=3344657 RepID=UPI0035D4A2C6
MKAYCYIIFSEKLNRYYIGSIELEVEVRLKMHNERHYGRTKFTAAANDWVVYLEIECESISKA